MAAVNKLAIILCLTVSVALTSCQTAMDVLYGMSQGMSQSMMMQSNNTVLAASAPVWNTTPTPTWNTTPAPVWNNSASWSGTTYVPTTPSTPSSGSGTTSTAAERLNQSVGDKCMSCHGTGKCSACGGTKVASGMGNTYACTLCDANGNCPVCHGTGKAGWNR